MLPKGRLQFKMWIVGSRMALRLTLDRRWHGVVRRLLRRNILAFLVLLALLLVLPTMVDLESASAQCNDGVVSPASPLPSSAVLKTRLASTTAERSSTILPSAFCQTDSYTHSYCPPSYHRSIHIIHSQHRTSLILIHEKAETALFAGILRSGEVDVDDFAPSAL